MLVRAPVAQIRAHVAYHLARGIDHVYVGLDAPTAALEQALSDEPRITVVACSPAFWKACHIAPDTRIQLRQGAFARHARELAAARKIDWLIHLDVDELLWWSGDALRAELAAATTDVVTFKNAELIPPGTGDGDCSFAAGRLFRRQSTSKQRALARTLGAGQRSLPAHTSAATAAASLRPASPAVLSSSKTIGQQPTAFGYRPSLAKASNCCTLSRLGLPTRPGPSACRALDTRNDPRGSVAARSLQLAASRDSTS